MCRVSVPCLSLWERWPSAARTERANHDHTGPLSHLRRQLSQRESQGSVPRYIGAYRGGVRPSAPTHVHRTCALPLPCHSEPVRRLAWESVPRARRRETPKPPLCKGRWDCPKGRSAPRRGVLLPPAAKVPKNAVQTCGLKIPYAPSPAAYHVKTNHANAVLCNVSLNLASSLLLFSLPLLL